MTGMISERVYGIRILGRYRVLLNTVRKHVRNPDLKLIREAFRFANRAHRHQRRLSGEPYIIHPLAVAETLAAQGLDSNTIAAALLHDVVEDTEYGEETLDAKFGAEIVSLVRAVTKISHVKKDTAKMNRDAASLNKEKEAAENIRLMLLATAKDLRVILIKLADKLHNMRTLQYQKPEKIERIAREVLSIYAPIAGRLGMFRVKSELEDLAFASLMPERYAQIRDEIKATNTDHEAFLNTIGKILKQRLAEINIRVDVSGRAKHIYSIYQKMENNNKHLSEIYDLRGVRILVDEIKDCYGALGIVHTLWPPIPGRFKDYIATPKSNGYRSLHTTVVGPDGKPLEVQIRTREMDEMADYGIAAHWIYKNEVTGGQPDPTKIKWLSRIARLIDPSDDSGDFIEDLRQELNPEEVYVFSPQGDVIDLPRGATVLDFAFRIHTQIGLTCRGAKVNDMMVPLRTELKSGDRVEIITEKSPNPSPNWLRYIKSSKARQKLRQYFRKLEEDEIRETVPVVPPVSVPPKSRKYSDLTELRIRRRQTVDPKSVPIEVAGAKDIPVRYAGCCTPVPGDRIVGFITRGKGVTVHRVDCPHLPRNDLSRYISVRWEGLTEKYPVMIEVRANDRQGLYLDLVGQITKTYTNILKAEADIPKSGGNSMTARFLLEVEHVDHLREILESLFSVKGVVSVDRHHEKSKG
jgi:GTP pyrophosphokinase